MTNASDLAAVRQTALDYVEAWYEGNAERMARALHPLLQKRIVERNPATDRDRVREMSAALLLGYTREGGGRDIPADQQQKDITVLDLDGNVASAKVVFLEWIDYLHLARFDGRWVIMNILWQMKPRA